MLLTADGDNLNILNGVLPSIDTLHNSRRQPAHRFTELKFWRGCFRTTCTLASPRGFGCIKPTSNFLSRFKALIYKKRSSVILHTPFEIMVDFPTTFSEGKVILSASSPALHPH